MPGCCREATPFDERQWQWFWIDAGAIVVESETGGEHQNTKILTNHQTFLNKPNFNCQQTNKSADAATVDRPDIHRPTAEWKQIQFAEFTQLRHQIAQLRPQFARRRAATAEAAAAAQSAGGADIELPDIESQSEWREFMHTNRPLLSTVLRLDQPSLETLLEYQLEWLLQGNVLGGVDDMDDEDEDEDEATVVAAASVAPISDWDVASLAALGRWIYSLLGCLHSPLEPSVHSTLRGIAKAALGIRNGLPTTGADATGMAAPLNLLVCIIAENFGQSDLSERV